MENQERIKYLRTFFNGSTAAFSFMETIFAQIGKELPAKTKDMYKLHLEGRAELEKENPNMDRVSFIIQQCEILAATPKGFDSLQSGGIIHEPHEIGEFVYPTERLERE